MLEKHVHPAIKDGLSFTTRSLLFCLLSALWHIDTLPTETVYNFVSFELSSFENSHQRCDVSVMWTLQPLRFTSINLSSQYYPWIKHEGYENRGNDHHREQKGERAYWCSDVEGYMTPHLQILVHPETWLLCPVQFHPSPWQRLVLLCLCQSTMIQASQNYKNYMFYLKQ